MAGNAPLPGNPGKPGWWQPTWGWPGWRLPVLSVVLAFFSFVLFPLYLLNQGLESTLALRQHNARTRLARQLSQRLDQLETMKEDRYFFHRVLQEVVLRAERSEQPKKSLKRAIRHLRAKIPGGFQFTVWDEAGNLIPELTDGVGMKHIRGATYRFLAAVSANATADNPGEIKELPEFRRLYRLV